MAQMDMQAAQEVGKFQLRCSMEDGATSLFHYCSFHFEFTSHWGQLVGGKSSTMLPAHMELGR
jgi:hypothetical protein